MEGLLMKKITHRLIATILAVALAFGAMVAGSVQVAAYTTATVNTYQKGNTYGRTASNGTKHTHTKGDAVAQLAPWIHGISPIAGQRVALNWVYHYCIQCFGSDVGGNYYDYANSTSGLGAMFGETYTFDTTADRKNNKVACKVIYGKEGQIWDAEEEEAGYDILGGVKTIGTKNTFTVTIPKFSTIQAALNGSDKAYRSVANTTLSERKTLYLKIWWYYELESGTKRESSSYLPLLLKLVYAPGDHGKFAEQLISPAYGTATPLPSVNTSNADAGYTFAGWKSSLDGKTYQTNALPTVTDAVTYTAQWTPNGYQITYDTNGGTPSPLGPQTKIHGQNLTLLTTRPSKTGATFKNWKADTDGATYNPGDTFTRNEKTTLTAQYDADQYDVTYNLNGASGSPPATQKKIHGTTLALSTSVPSWPGYSFLGWGTSPNAITVAYAPGANYTANEDVTLYAIWAKDISVNSSATATIARLGQTALFKFTPSTSGKYYFYSIGSADTYGHLYSSPATSMTQLLSNDDGGENTNFQYSYSFSAGTTYYLGVRYYNNNTIGSVNVTLGGTYEIAYNAAPGSNAPPSQEKIHGQTLVLSSLRPTPQTGESFNNWKASNGTSYEAGANYTANEATTLTAQYSVDNYRVSYNNNGIFSFVNADYELAYDSPTPAAPTVSDNSDYHFVGWSPVRTDKVTDDVTYNALGEAHQKTTVQTKTPTCEEDGLKITYCTKQGCAFGSTYPLESTVLSALGHDWGDWVVVRQETPERAGLERRICKRNANHIEERDIYNDCVWTTKQTIVADCEHGGQVIEHCAIHNHDQVRKGSETPKIAHDWNDWTISTPASCESSGIKVRVCKRYANHTETDTIPALGHNYGNWFNPEVGLEKRVCQRDSNHVEMRNSTFPRALTMDEIYWFANDMAYFGPKNEGYNITEEHFMELKRRIGVLEGKASDNYVNLATYLAGNFMPGTSWNGSCYGMAVTTMLNKNKNQSGLRQIDFSKNFGGGAASLRQVPSPIQSEMVESTINYYMMSQIIPAMQSTESDFATIDTQAYRDALTTLVNDTKKGTSALFGYLFSRAEDGKKCGHAIVVLSYGGFVDGKHVLLSYDNRYPDQDTMIEVSADFTSCTVLAKTNEKVTGFYAKTDLSCFDAIDLDGPQNDMVLSDDAAIALKDKLACAKITFQASDEDLTIRNANGETLIYNAETGTVSGSMKILRSSFIVGSTSNGEPVPAIFSYDVADSSRFLFEAKEPGLDVSVVAEGLFASASSENAEQVSIEKGKGVSVLGDGLYDCKLGLGVNNGACDILQLNAKADQTASLQFSGNKVIASADYDYAGSITFCSNIVNVNTKALTTTSSSGYEISWDANGNPIVKAIVKDTTPQPRDILPGGTVTLVRKEDSSIFHDAIKAYNVATGKTGNSLRFESTGKIDVANDGKITYRFAAIGKATVRAYDGNTLIDSVDVNVKWTWHWILVILLFGWLYL
jgi:uncharacterized repeat protein (TIGR02543 family)